MKAKILIIILLVILIGGLILMGIFHDRVVASRDKGMAEDWNADHKIQGNVDFRYYTAENMRLENRTDWPAGSVEGQIIWRSDLDAFYIFDGTDWQKYLTEGEIDDAIDNAINTQVAIKKGTYYWSCAGSNFIARNPDTDQVRIDHDEGDIYPQEDGIQFGAPVFLPHGAVVTAVIVFGDAAAAAESWTLNKDDIDDINTTAMATANINTQDTTITDPTINNNLYRYYFRTTTLDTSDTIYGARIRYTL